MALWGNKDNVGSGSTVTLDYSNRVVSGWAGTATGTGTTFGQIGAAKTGDTITFGEHGGTFYGEAVIASIGSTLQVTIASTDGLSGAAIAGAENTISEKPTWLPTDPAFSARLDASPSLTALDWVATADAASGVGTDIIYVSSGSTFIEAGNTLLNDSNDIAIASIAATTISLGSTISAAISAADELTIKEWQGGYDNYAYGIASGGVDASLGTQFETGVGWVGVQTYMAQGTLRIKKEILVSMSGITTGNSPAYPDMN